jgi:hypothetical protein
VIARLVILGLLLTALIAGALLYYMQVYAFYDTVSAEQAGGIELVSVTSLQPEPVLFDDFAAIDADSSPLRYRACFTTPLSLAMLTETYEIYDAAEPLTAPGWFDCFDAKAIGEGLESGDAIAFLAQENVHYGVDRVVAIFADGRGYAWHQINACGAVVFAGEPAPEGCPTPPESVY